ncbi:MAG: Mur ligase domain-containing protein [Desulfopila sp.]
MLSLATPLNSAPDKIDHIHLMGICGTGMAALAGMLQSSGYRITGSDSQVYPPMSIFLEELNIPVCKRLPARCWRLPSIMPASTLPL